MSDCSYMEFKTCTLERVSGLTDLRPDMESKEVMPAHSKANPIFAAY
jgi:hypothetical protein